MSKVGVDEVLPQQSVSHKFGVWCGDLETSIIAGADSSIAFWEKFSEFVCIAAICYNLLYDKNCEEYTVCIASFVITTLGMLVVL